MPIAAVSRLSSHLGGSQPELARLQAALQTASQKLLDERASDGGWTGELSASALSTATAVCALSIFAGTLKKPDCCFEIRIERGLQWLADHQNGDGGWGDTVRSISNISTTVLCWASFGAVPGADGRYHATLATTERWLTDQARGIAPDYLARSILDRYGKDRTFSVPILTTCALSGRLGPGKGAWKYVLPLPFELAAFPHQFFAALRLPVVSYALPALVAIGQARHFHAPPGNPVIRLLRTAARGRTLKVLTKIQPENGGFLEATPLTSFVVMSLAGSGKADHLVTRRGINFIRASQREDGSWPIDTNLTTWLTTLAVNGCSKMLTANAAAQISEWLIRQQFRVMHPYTHAPAGGWAWTDLPGGVPDADDTAGAVLALKKLASLSSANSEGIQTAALAGMEWLLKVQNRDGGIPTFCPGWGALPFDRSSADITAHMIRAFLAWRDAAPVKLRKQMDRAIHRALGFLIRTQRNDGAWIPLWFGNQAAPEDENPTYGTSRVLLALAEIAEAGGDLDRVQPSLARGVAWLTENEKGGAWGGSRESSPSIEETACAMEALVAIARSGAVKGKEDLRRTIDRAADWLIARVESGEWTQPAPIGFYFAKLWYYEKLYPLIFTVSALAAYSRLLDGEHH